MMNANQVWENPEFSLAQAARAGNFREWLRSCTIQIGRTIADPPNNEEPITCSPDQMKALERKILDECKSLSGAHLDSQILGKVVAGLNLIGPGTIPQPTISNLFTYPRNPFRDGVVDDLRRVRAWLDVESNWSSECAEHPPVELVVLSGIHHGALFEVRSVVRFTRLLFVPEQAIGFIGGRSYIDIALPGEGNDDVRHRNWHPDEQTASLIRPPQEYGNVEELLGPGCKERNPDSLSDEKLADRLFRRIVQRMRRNGLDKTLLPRSLKDLIDAVTICARMEMPSVLVDYACGRLLSHPPKQSALPLVDGIPALGQDKEAEAESEDECAEEDLPDLNDKQERIEQKWLINLREALGAESSAAARHILSELLSMFDDRSSAGWFITSFAEYLLCRRQVERPGAASSKELKLSTVRKWAIIVGRRVAGLLKSRETLPLTAQSLGSLYIEVLENVIEGKNPQLLRKTVARALREFQEFLIIEHQAEPINEREIFGIDRGLLPVDARVLSVEAFQEARHIIRYEMGTEFDERILMAAEAMLILGFRCCTRRMEARNLHVNDLVDQGPEWLFIRPWGEHDLKTGNATRQLYLRAHVPREELAILLDWKRLRLEEGCSADDPYLFGIPALGYKVIPVDVVIPIIHDAIRKAAGDKEQVMHFHHLRHSGATWKFLLLMLSDLPQIPDLFPNLPLTTAWLHKSKSFRILLYGHGSPTKQHALAIACQLGHSSCRVSALFYLHCMDWILPLFVNQSSLLGIPTTRKAVVASARAQSTAYGWQQKANLKALEAASEAGRDSTGVRAEGGISIELIYQNFPGLISSLESRIARPPIKSITQGNDLWCKNCWALLFLHATTTEPLHSIADRLGFNLKEARLFLKRAEQIQQITERVGWKSARHEMELWVRDRRLANSAIAIACPARVRPDGGVEELREVEQSLARLSVSQPELMQKMLGYYANNVWRTETVLPFRDPEVPEDAVRYLKFLDALGISKKSIRFVFFSQAERSPFRSQWKKALGLTWRDHGSIAVRNAPFGESLASRKWIAIEPDLDFGDGESVRAKEFRFLMVMAAIAFGFRCV